MYEALYNAVPMVLIPQGLDQMDNAVRMVAKGVAVKLDRLTVDEAQMYEAITEVLNQKKYVQITIMYVGWGGWGVGVLGGCLRAMLSLLICFVYICFILGVFLWGCVWGCKL